MATTAATLIQRCRRFMGDWPENDALTASVASGGTTLTVADGTLYSQGWVIQIDNEALYVTTSGTGTSVPVRRAVRGSTAASHANAATVLLRPHFLDVEYLDALNSGINASFPLLYQPVVDESVTTSASSYQYTVPNLNGTPIPYLSRLSVKETGDVTFRQISDWEILRGSAPIVKLRRPVGAGTLRIQGFGPLPTLSSLSDSLNTLYPVAAEDALTFYVGQFLLASGEARRVREDTGARDDRESANRLGGSLSASQAILQRFYGRLQQSAMPPMPKTIKSVL